MFKFRSRETKANDTLLQLAKQGDSFTHSLTAHIARSKGHINLNVQDTDGNTALMLAVTAGAPGNAGVLLGQAVNVNIANHHADTPLMAAIALGLEGTARDLVLGGADISAKNKQGKTAADIAAAGTDKDIIALLPYLRQEKPLDGLRAEIAKEQADRAVIAAAKAGDAAAIEKAVAAGGSAGAIDRDGHSALMWAATENSRAGIKALVALGADVNYQNIPGRDYSALIVAAVRGNDAAAEALLAAGAKTDLKTEKGRTAFQMAIKSGNPRLALLLAAHELRIATTEAGKDAANGLKATAELVQGVQDNNPFLAQDAISRGADLTVELAEGYSFVTRAARGGNNFILSMLLTAGANPDAPDAKGRVPVLEAAGNGNGIAVRGLIDAGADVNRKDKKGESVLDLVKKNGWEDIAAQIAALQKSAEVKQEARDITAPVAQPAAPLSQTPPKQAPKP